MAHNKKNCKHLTITIFIDYETKAIKKLANCTNCLMEIEFNDKTNFLGFDLTIKNILNEVKN